MRSSETLRRKTMKGAWRSVHRAGKPPRIYARAARLTAWGG